MSQNFKARQHRRLFDGETDINPNFQKLLDKNSAFLNSLGKNPMLDACIEEIDGRKIRIGNKWLIDYASCNYLGFDLDQEIIDSIPEYTTKWGTHPSWSRLLGNPKLYPELEQRLAELLKVEAVLVMPSLSLLSQEAIFVLSEGEDIFLDKYSHRTLYEGAKNAQGRGANLNYFKNYDLEELEEMLMNSRARKKLICVDAVFSMHGKYANLPLLANLARKYDALIYLDDAHGFGIVGEQAANQLCPYGSKGNGLINFYGESYDNIIMISCLSKAYSSYSAFLTCTKRMQSRLKSLLASYLYSGPAPIASLATALTGLKVNEKRGDKIRADLYRKSKKLHDSISKLNFRSDNETDFPIFNIYLENQEDLDFVADYLFQSGIYVTLCPYPMVAQNDVGFRIQMTAANTDEEVDHLISVLTRLAGIVKIQRELVPALNVYANSPG